MLAEVELGSIRSAARFFIFVRNAAAATSDANPNRSRKTQTRMSSSDDAGCCWTVAWKETARGKLSRTLTSEEALEGRRSRTLLDAQRLGRMDHLTSRFQISGAGFLHGCGKQREARGANKTGNQHGSGKRVASEDDQFSVPKRNIVTAQRLGRELEPRKEGHRPIAVAAGAVGQGTNTDATRSTPRLDAFARVRRCGHGSQSDRCAA